MKGTVQQISEKQWDGKVLYSFKLNDAWFGCGEVNPRLSKGDVVEFDYATSPAGRNNVRRDSLKILKTGEAVIEVGKAPVRWAKAGGANAAKDKYWEEREARDVKTQEVIQLQASRNSAIALADVLLKAGCVKLPTAVNKQYDAVLALVGELTEKFEAESRAKRLGSAMIDPIDAHPVPDDAISIPVNEDEEIWNG